MCDCTNSSFPDLVLFGSRILNGDVEVSNLEVIELLTYLICAMPILETRVTTLLFIYISYKQQETLS